MIIGEIHFIAAVEKHILTVLHSVKMQVQHNTTVLQTLSRDKAGASVAMEQPEGVDFPLEDMASLDSFEEMLREQPELRKAIVRNVFYTYNCRPILKKLTAISTFL